MLFMHSFTSQAEKHLKCSFLAMCFGSAITFLILYQFLSKEYGLIILSFNKPTRFSFLLLYWISRITLCCVFARVLFLYGGLSKLCYFIDSTLQILVWLYAGIISTTCLLLFFFPSGLAVSVFDDPVVFSFQGPIIQARYHVLINGIETLILLGTRQLYC